MSNVKRQTEPAPITALELAEIANKVGLLYLNKSGHLSPTWLDGVNLMPYMEKFAITLNEHIAKKACHERDESR